MIDTTKLRELAQAVKGWSNCNRFWNDEDHDNGVYIVGHINEDDEKYPLFEIDADGYGTDDESGKLAEFYAAANPATVLALLDELASMREDLSDARNGWERATSELNDAAQCIANQSQTIGQLQDQLKASIAAGGIDDRFGGRLAFMLECSILDPHGCFDEACRLLDEYKAEWEKANPSPPTFMGEPMPPERKARLLEMKRARALKQQEES